MRSMLSGIHEEINATHTLPVVRRLGASFGHAVVHLRMDLGNKQSIKHLLHIPMVAPLVRCNAQFGHNGFAHRTRISVSGWRVARCLGKVFLLASNGHLVVMGFPGGFWS